MIPGEYNNSNKISRLLLILTSHYLTLVGIYIRLCQNGLRSDAVDTLKYIVEGGTAHVIGDSYEINNQILRISVLFNYPILFRWDEERVESAANPFIITPEKV